MAYHTIRQLQHWYFVSKLWFSISAINLPLDLRSQAKSAQALTLNKTHNYELDLILQAKE